MRSVDASCFHCGEPLGADARRHPIAGQERPFCCAGCMAVADAIAAAGLLDYYTLRTASGPRAIPSAVPPAWFDRADARPALVADDAGTVHARLALDRVRCPACLWLIGETLRRLPDVASAHVDYVSQTARIAWAPGSARLGPAIEAVEALGYRARPCTGRETEAIERLGARRDGARLVFASIAGMAVMNGALAIYLAGGGSPLPLWESVVRWLSAVVCLPLLAWAGADFFAGAWRDARNGRLGMDVPIALGLAASYVGSLPGLLSGGAVYFDAIAMLIPTVLLARWLEIRVRRRAAAAIDRLSILEPVVARRIRSDGTEERVHALDLVPGDVVRVIGGDAVPADGCVAEGMAHLDESHLNGEPLPRSCPAGAPVAAGSVNRGQAFLLRVTQRAGAGTLGELQRLLERGVAQRPPLADAADRLAPALVGIVLVASALTWLAWQAIDPARALPAMIAVLVVTCPCALALATPLTLALAAGHFAARGVVPLRLGALDALAVADTAAFDKTGTLTHGVLVLANVQTCGPLGQDDARAIAFALERDSQHPIAAALRATAHVDGTRVDDLVVEARGVRGAVDGWAWRFGDLDFVGELPARVRDAALAERARGAMVAVLGDGSERWAVFAFDDLVRPGLARLGPGLRALGVRTLACLSGDAGPAVQRCAKAAGFDRAHGGMTPAQKLEWVERERARGRRVLMVGDGLNDTATLAAADASISFADAPRMSRFAADFLVTADSLDAIPRARAAARRARNILRQNLGWAALYNLAAIPLAAAGLVPPWLAALGMAASSVVVVLNASRLARSVRDDDGGRRG